MISNTLPAQLLHTWVGKYSVECYPSRTGIPGSKQCGIILAEKRTKGKEELCMSFEKAGELFMRTTQKHASLPKGLQGGLKNKQVNSQILALNSFRFRTENKLVFLLSFGFFVLFVPIYVLQCLIKRCTYFLFFYENKEMKNGSRLCALLSLNLLLKR